MGTFGKKVISSVLSAAIVVSVLPTAFAENGADDEALISELLSYSDQYPDGSFAFREGQLSATEDDGTVWIDIVRYGSFEGEADVTFKALDISAAYGKDYTLTVDEGWFISRELEPDDDSELLSDMYGGVNGEVTIGEEPTEEPEAEQNISLSVDEDGILDVKDSGNEKPEEELTGLRAARAKILGEASDRASWQEVTGADDPAAEVAATSMDKYDEYVSEFGEDVPGTEYTLHFADGEYVKRIRADIIDDEVSETDEQVMLMLYNASGAEIAKPGNAYINIIDTDENEPVTFAMLQDSITATPAEGYAEVTVERISGVEKFASVTVGTGAIDAEPDVDYKSGSVEVIFPQGVTSRTVKIPIYNAMRSEAKSFAVAIDKESAFADEKRYATAVTILPDYSEKSLELYAAAFEGTDKEGVNFDIYLPPTDEGALRVAGSENHTSNLISSYAESPRNATTDWGNEITLLTGLDLRNANSITVEFEGKGWYETKETYKDGCKKKTRKVKYYNRQAMFTVGGETRISESTAETVNDRITITGFSKSKDQSLKIKVRKTKSANIDNHYVYYDIKKVTIEYQDILLYIDNSIYDTNTYTEKVYSAGNVKTDQGLGYSEGRKLDLGNGYVNANGDISATFPRFSSGMDLMVQNDKDQLTTENVAAKIGTNVYLAGWQYYKKNGNVYSSEIIRPDQMTLETLYNKLGSQSDFQIRPVFKPYPSMVRFNNSSANKLEYTNNIKNGQEIGITMLDTIKLEANPVGTGGYAVDSFLVRGYLDGAAHMSVGTKRAELADALSEKARGSGRTEYLDAHKNANNTVLTEYSEADSSRIVIKPNCEAIYVDMTDTTPKIDVRFNPSDATPQTYKNMGSVFYIDTETETSAYGDWTTPMTVQPVQYGKEYRINAAYEDVNMDDPESTEEPESQEKIVSDYKTVWQDFTGDVNGDGELSPAEAAALSRYGLDRSSYTGDVMGYMPKVTNSQIYYYFTRREIVQGAGGIYGIVLLQDYPVFGVNEKTLKPVNGATVTVDDKSVVTDYDEKFGGMQGIGGDGYFEIYDKTFVAGEAHRINIVYGPLSLAAVHNVNVAQTYVLDAYDIISVNSASRTRGGAVMKTTDPMLNDDKEYVLTFATVSSISTKTAQKAKLTFYRRDGSIITSKEYESTGTNTGVFNCAFNPHSLGIPAGATVTVTFTDNDGISYFEHDTGLFFQQSLGALSLLSSFAGGASPAFDVIGQVSSAFGFGWDGNLDDDTGKISFDPFEEIDNGGYSIETTTEKKVLNLNLLFRNRGKLGGDDKDKDESKDSGEGLSQDEVKDIARDDNSSINDIKNAADKTDEKKKSSEQKITKSYRLNLSFGLELTLNAAQDPAHKGEWAFGSFIFMVNVLGELRFSTTYTTPIGVPITLGAAVGADACAIIVVESRLGREYYMSNLMSGDGGSVDLINSGHKYSDYMYVYGKFSVYPFVELSAKVGWTNFGATLSGRMTFGLDYNGKTDVFSGNLQFTCKLKIKVVIFTKKWTLADSGKINLFSTAAELYESLDDFDVSERENLKYRSGWNGEDYLSVAAVKGLTEHDLQTGVDPDAEFRLMPLDNGKYIALFIDDAPERSKSNSNAVYYTIYDGTGWTQPQIIENDGTVDDAPAIADVGNGRLFAAWSTANQEFDEDPGVIDSLNQMNIHGVFIDKATGNFIGDVMEVTKNTSADITRDSDPHIAYDSESNRMIVYYTKEEYEATITTADEGDEDTAPGVFGDLTYPYSSYAYRLYDLSANEFIGYSDEELHNFLGAEYSNETAEEFSNDYYGQYFLDLAPTVIIDRALDDSGYQLGGTNLSKYVGTNDPLIIESDAIGYNHLGLYAYVLDYDGRKDTTYDRDIFLQIYNFAEDSMSYPILLTENSTAESTDNETQPNLASDLHFERIGGENGITYLAYLSGGSIKLIDLSENISSDNVLKEGELEGTKYYYLDKTEASGYIPEITVISPEQQGDYTGERGISSFDIRSNDDFVYFMFTELQTKPKDGIEEGSSEAAKPENRVAETQIYMKRFDIENSIMTNAVQVTEAEGMNYNNISFAVEEDGFTAMATRCGTTLVEMGDSLAVEPDYDRSTITAITFRPDANVELKNGMIDEITAGGTVNASFEVYNGGIETIDGLTVEVKDADGSVLTPKYSSVADKELETASYDEASGSVSLIGGEKELVTMSIPVGEDGNSAGFTATVKDSYGSELDSITVSKTAERKLDVSFLDAEISERGVLTFDAVLTNNQRVKSGKETFELVTADGDVLYEATVDPILPDEDIHVSDTVELDYDKLFKIEPAEDGSINSELELTATAGAGDQKKTVSLYATAEQMARLNAVKSVTFNDGKRVKLSEGTTLDLAPVIKAGEYKGGRVDDNNETEIDAPGVELLYTSSNDDVVTVYSNGYIAANKPGRATITAELVPSDASYDGEAYIQRYATLPDEAIKTYKISVEVDADSSATEAPHRSRGGGGGATIVENFATPAPTVAPAATTAPETQPDGSTWFTDVPETSWFYGSVKSVFDKGLMNGVTDTVFEPDTNVTRAMFAAILYRAAGEPETNADITFTDVPADSYYRNAVAWAQSYGIIEGYDEETFAPGDNITREQMAALMWRYAAYAGIDTSAAAELNFIDSADVSAYAAEAMSWVCAAGIIGGYDDNTLRPAAFATRAQTAAVIDRFTGLK